MFVVILFMVSGCTKVNPGYVGIKVNMLGSSRGVENSPQVTGIVFYEIYF